MDDGRSNNGPLEKAEPFQIKSNGVIALTLTLSSVSVATVEPIMMQKSVLAHEIEVRIVLGSTGNIGSAFQVEPSYASIKAVTEPAEIDSPSAKHIEAAGQATDPNRLSVPGDGKDIGCTELPCSIYAAGSMPIREGIPEDKLYVATAPTAMQPPKGMHESLTR